MASKNRTISYNKLKSIAELDEHWLINMLTENVNILKSRVVLSITIWESIAIFDALPIVSLKSSLTWEFAGQIVQSVDVNRQLLKHMYCKRFLERRVLIQTSWILLFGRK